MRSLQEIVALPPSPFPQAICDGGNGKSERVVSFLSSTLGFINSPVNFYIMIQLSSMDKHAEMGGFSMPTVILN